MSLDPETRGLSSLLGEPGLFAGETDGMMVFFCCWVPIPQADNDDDGGARMPPHPHALTLT